MAKNIIGFVGLIASGKDVSKKYLEKEYKAVSFKFSSVLRDALDCLGIEQSRDNLITLSTWSRQTFGNDLLAKAIAKKVENSNNDLIIIDGIRRLSDIDYLTRNPNFHMVAIEADEKIRYNRSISRNENPGDADKTYEAFLADHKKETEITIPETMDKAEIKIDNNKDLDNLYKQLDELMSKFDIKKI